MNRILFLAGEQFTARISSVDGGSLRNAIPRESVAIITIPQKNETAFTAFIKEQADILKAEYLTTDPNFKLECEPAELPQAALASDFQNKLLRSVYACPNGIFRMSPDIAGLVQTSNNIARILVKDSTFIVQCLTRSAVDSEKMDLARGIKSAFELCGATVNFAGGYPGWAPKPESPIVKLMSELYNERYGEEALVNACHAGLECGILGNHYPEMQMISFGPNIRGAHSPDEKVQISSVQKYWEFLLETLKQIPEKAGSQKAAVN